MSVLTLLGCDREQEILQEQTAIQRPSAEVGVTNGGQCETKVDSSAYSPDWGDSYVSLRKMVATNDVIVVGTPRSILLPYDPRPGYLGVPTPEPVPPGHPKAGAPTPSAEELARPPGRFFTVYSVEIDTIVTSDNYKPGTEIAVLQNGGMFNGEADNPPDDALIEIGCRYLFFLDEFVGLRDIAIEQPWGTTFSGPPWGRFYVDGQGRLDVATSEWKCSGCLGPLEIVGQDVGGAVSAVLQAAALGPGSEVLPTALPTPGVAVPAPTPGPLLPLATTAPPIPALPTPTAPP